VSQPQNGEEAGYAAVALFDALIDLLLKRQVIGQEDLNSIGVAAAASLSVASNSASNRAAHFVRAWVADKE